MVLASLKFFEFYVTHSNWCVNGNYNLYLIMYNIFAYNIIYNIIKHSHQWVYYLLNNWVIVILNFLCYAEGAQFLLCMFCPARQSLLHLLARESTLQLIRIENISPKLLQILYLILTNWIFPPTVLHTREWSLLVSLLFVITINILSQCKTARGGRRDRLQGNY